MTNSSIASIHDVLEQYRKVAFDEYDKGSHFEKLMQAFLRTEPQYAELYDQVWRWSEHPERGRITPGPVVSVVGERQGTTCRLLDDSDRFAIEICEQFTRHRRPR